MLVAVAMHKIIKDSIHKIKRHTLAQPPPTVYVTYNSNVTDRVVPESAKK